MAGARFINIWCLLAHVHLGGNLGGEVFDLLLNALALFEMYHTIRSCQEKTFNSQEFEGPD